MKNTLLLLLFSFVFTLSCRQFVNFDKDWYNAKKMSGVWDAYENDKIKGTLIMYYNLDNKLEENTACYYRTYSDNIENISYYRWWMHRNDTLFLLNTDNYVTYKYVIKELSNSTCKLRRLDGTSLTLIRKKY